MTIISDSFTGGRDAAWANEGTGFTYGSNQMSCSGSAAISLWWDGGSGARGDDQYAQCRIVTRSTVSGEGPGPACRIGAAPGPAYTYGYFVHCNSSNTTLYESSAGGAYQSKGTGAAVTNGDVVRLICNGTSIEVYNVTTATTLISITDATLTGGFVGVRGYGTGTIDDFEAGDYADLGGGTTLPLPVWHDDSPVVLFQ